ncbi:MAG: type III-B CRISPR module-associated protein Cmr5 [Candidatus Omnitrophica bacterium]|nr:type III-B CRISPR module-associated protein Cmr5 [Candidatus Omnitrophota bacterium]
MNFQTLAQRRAAIALKRKKKDESKGENFRGKNEGNVVSGFPMLIRTDGFLPALAYAIENKEDKQTQLRKPKNQGEFQIAAALVEHLTNEGILKQSKSPEDMVRELALAADASQLRRATAEALAFLNYLKRFVV